MAQKCSLTPCQLRFFRHFCLVLVLLAKDREQVLRACPRSVCAHQYGVKNGSKMLIDAVSTPLFSSFLPGLGFAQLDREQALTCGHGLTAFAQPTGAENGTNAYRA